jgi:hypothetical protein
MRMVALKGSVRGLQLTNELEAAKKEANVRILLTSISGSGDGVEHDNPH